MHRICFSPVFFLLVYCSFFYTHANEPFYAIQEGDPNSFVDGVSTIHGDYTEFEKDVVVAGPDPLTLSRFYTSHDSPLYAQFGGWRFLPKCFLFMKKDPKKKPYTTVEGQFAHTYVQLGTDEGSILTFVGWQNITHSHQPSLYHIDLDESMFFLANTARGEINAWTNLKNYHLSCQGDVFKLILSNQGERYYLKHPSKDVYLLQKEVLPSRNKILYEYDQEGRPTFLKMVNETEDKTLSWITMQYGQTIHVETSDHQCVLYHFTQNTPDSSCLTSCHFTHKPSIDYSYEVTKNHPLLIAKEQPESRIKNIAYQIDQEGRYRVHTITKPLSDSLAAKKEFTYHLEEDGSGYTEIRGSQKEKTLHFYNPDLQLTSIEEYLDEAPYRIYKNIWGEESDACNLWQTSIEDRWGNVFYAKTFAYDSYGRILAEKEYGNLTGSHPDPLIIDEEGFVNPSLESNSKTYVYKQVDGFDVVEQIDAKGSGIRMCYLQGTNLLMKKFILSRNKRKKRWFYEYNEDKALTQILVDDGEASHLQDSFFSKKILTKISPKQQLPSLGIPEIIEEKYIDPLGEEEVLLKKTINHFDSEGNIVKQEICDAEGISRYTLRKHYENDLLTMETDPLGNETYYTYDLSHNLIQEEEQSTGMSIYYTYDRENRLLSVSKKGKHQTFTTSHAYNSSGQKISEIDCLGNETTYLMDSLGRITSMIHPKIVTENGQTYSPSYSYEYDLFDHVTKVTDPHEEVTVKENTPTGLPIRIQYPDGFQELFKYDLTGSLHRHLDRTGLIQVFEYDNMGRVNHIEFYERGSQGKQDGYKRRYKEYDAFHQTAEEDEEGNTTSYSYDGAGRLTTLLQDKKKIEFLYDSLGRQSAVKIWKSDQTYTCKKKEYDLLGNVTLKTTEDETGKLLTKTEYVYNDANQLISIIGYPHNKKTRYKQFVYDDFGRITKQIDAEGFETNIYYESSWIEGQGVIKKITLDPLGNTLEEIYDSENRLISSEKKDAAKTLLSSVKTFHDACGYEILRQEMVIGNNKKRDDLLRKTYFSNHHLKEVHLAADSPEEKVLAYTYNLYGDLVTKQEATSPPLSYTYDNKGNLTSIAFEEDLQEHLLCDFYFDDVGNITDIELPSSSILCRWNAHHQLTKEITKGKTHKYSVTCVYDGEGCVTTIELPDSSSLEYEYEGSFVKKVRRVSGDKKTLYQYQVFARDWMGNILEEILPFHAGARKTSYDVSGRKTDITTDFLQDTVSKKGYDPLGNLHKHTLFIEEEARELSYTYNALQQILSEKGKVEHTYTYDSLGNRLSKDQSIYTLNAANELLDTEEASYTFDDRGNVVTKHVEKNTWSFQYNLLNQLIKITLPNETVITFTYDVTGRRLTKKISASKGVQTFRYFYLGKTELGCLDTKGNIIELRIPSNPNQDGKEPYVAFELKKQVYVPLYDLQGNVTLLIDPKKRTIRESYQHSVFGEESIFNHLRKTVYRSPLKNPWRYRGNRMDEETGLVYIGCRYYDPEIGRWLSPDPANDLDGTNRYVYCHNNPLIYLDISGLATERNTTVDESYFYGEYEPHCHCERHRDCKKGGHIAADPSLSIANAIDLSLELLTHPRMQGSMQAFVGLAESSAGAFATLSSGGLASPIGWPILTHGLDQLVAGLHTAFTGEKHFTLTEQLLQHTGIPSNWATSTNDILSIAGTMGGSSVIRAMDTTNQSLIYSLNTKLPISKLEKQIFQYHPRIRIRAMQEPIAHNFPYSFDSIILKEVPITQSNKTLLYRKIGTLNGKEGIYEIGLNPDTKIIFHRTFKGS